MGRAKRYAQCHFVDMSALKHIMLEHVRCVFYNFAKTTSTSANIKTLKFHWKYVCFLIESKFLVPLTDHNFHVMLMLCQKHS